MAAKPKVVLTDYVWESLDVEKKTLAGLADLLALQTKKPEELDRKSTRLNSSHIQKSRMPSSA